MKTAEEIIQQMVDEMPFDLNKSCKPYIREAMEIYAKQCAEQALKDAAENAELEEIPSIFPYGISDWKVDKQSILDTPIVTP